MVNIVEFIEYPASDPEVSQVFTNEMFDKLDKRLTETAGWKSMREDMTFPTLDFPSDHGLLLTVLVIV